MFRFLPRVLFAAALTAGAIGASSLPKTASVTARVEPFLEQHCFDCHDTETKKGDLDLTALKFDSADATAFAAWVKVYDRVREGEMPPKRNGSPKAPR